MPSNGRRLRFIQKDPISKRGVNIRYHNPKRMTPRAAAPTGAAIVPND
jgi:hypothetical protein